MKKTVALSVLKNNERVQLSELLKIFPTDKKTGVFEKLFGNLKEVDSVLVLQDIYENLTEKPKSKEVRAMGDSFFASGFNIKTHNGLNVDQLFCTNVANDLYVERYPNSYCPPRDHNERKIFIASYINRLLEQLNEQREKTGDPDIAISKNGAAVIALLLGYKPQFVNFVGHKQNPTSVLLEQMPLIQIPTVIFDSRSDTRQSRETALKLLAANDLLEKKGTFLFKPLQIIRGEKLENLEKLGYVLITGDDGTEYLCANITLNEDETTITLQTVTSDPFSLLTSETESVCLTENHPDFICFRDRIIDFKEYEKKRQIVHQFKEQYQKDITQYKKDSFPHDEPAHILTYVEKMVHDINSGQLDITDLSKIDIQMIRMVSGLPLFVYDSLENDTFTSEQDETITNVRSRIQEHDEVLRTDLRVYGYISCILLLAAQFQPAFPVYLPKTSSSPTQPSPTHPPRPTSLVTPFSYPATDTIASPLALPLLMMSLPSINMRPHIPIMLSLFNQAVLVGSNQAYSRYINVEEETQENFEKLIKTCRQQNHVESFIAHFDNPERKLPESTRKDIVATLKRIGGPSYILAQSDQKMPNSNGHYGAKSIAGHNCLVFFPVFLRWMNDNEQASTVKHELMHWKYNKNLPGFHIAPPKETVKRLLPIVKTASMLLEGFEHLAMIREVREYIPGSYFMDTNFVNYETAIKTNFSPFIKDSNKSFIQLIQLLLNYQIEIYGLKLNDEQQKKLNKHLVDNIKHTFPKQKQRGKEFKAQKKIVYEIQSLINNWLTSSFHKTGTWSPKIMAETVTASFNRLHRLAGNIHFEARRYLVPIKDIRFDVKKETNPKEYKMIYHENKTPKDEL